MPVTRKQWWHEIVLMVAYTGCAIAVLLVLASSPDMDELWTGAAAGLVSFFIAKITGKSA